MTDLTLFIIVVIAVILLILVKIISRIGEEVEKMKLSYKLVIQRGESIVEEPFENFEKMIERVKALEAENAQPVAPVTPPVAPVVDANGVVIPEAGGSQVV